MYDASELSSTSSSLSHLVTTFGDSYNAGPSGVTHHNSGASP